MHKLQTLLLTLCLVLVALTQSHALNPDEVLSDPQLEQRARSLSAEIRCLVCQNQSIDDSDAQLARDLRLLVREQLVEGKSDDQILSYLVERYGEFVLLRPPLGIHTLALWGFPAFIFLVGAFVVWRFYRRRSFASPQLQPLEPEELEMLERLKNENPTRDSQA
ncbi:MAG: cytochrome c-type biogenesis protein [Pseudomonadota bacterium]